MTRMTRKKCLVLAEDGCTSCLLYTTDAADQRPGVA